MTARARGSDRRGSGRARPCRRSIARSRRARRRRHGPAWWLRTKSRRRSSGPGWRGLSPLSPPKKLRHAIVAVASTPRAFNSFSTPVGADLVELVERDQRVAVQRIGHARALEQRGERAAVIQANGEVLEPKPRQHLADRRQQFDFDDQRCRARSRRCRTDRTRGTVRAPGGRRATPAESGTA